MQLIIKLFMCIPAETKVQKKNLCSKCNEVFETDSKYIQHYNEKHKAEEKEQA
jgi:uncharacterized C2H2 Zn-finger protein